MDETDQQLLSLLRKDARTSVATLANKLGVSRGTVTNRIAKLDARRNNPVVDLVLLSDFGMLEAARKGLVQPLDYSQLKNYSQIYPFARNPIGGNYAVGIVVFAQQRQRQTPTDVTRAFFGTRERFGDVLGENPLHPESPSLL